MSRLPPELRCVPFFTWLAMVLVMLFLLLAAGGSLG